MFHFATNAVKRRNRPILLQIHSDGTKEPSPRSALKTITYGSNCRRNCNVRCIPRSRRSIRNSCRPCGFSRSRVPRSIPDLPPAAPLSHYLQSQTFRLLSQPSPISLHRPLNGTQEPSPRSTTSVARRNAGTVPSFRQARAASTEVRFLRPSSGT